MSGGAGGGTGGQSEKGYENVTRGTHFPTMAFEFLGKYK